MTVKWVEFTEGYPDSLWTSCTPCQKSLIMMFQVDGLDSSSYISKKQQFSHQVISWDLGTG